MIGSRLGPWTLDEEIGRGGMGRVYRAHDESTGRSAAVKVLAAELAQEAGFLQRFEREIEVLAKLDHPNIVHFYDAGQQDGIYYYAMEYVAGPTFDELLQEQGRLHWKEVLDAGLQVCSALKLAHNHGIIHRDLKPPNLMRTSDGVVKLTDFGIAKVFAGKQLTSAGTLVGTAEYLSPEQAAGKPVTNRSDLYSLGVVFYTLLTGRTPFEGTSILDLLHKHRYAQFTPPRKLVPEIPHEMEEIVCNLLEKDPGARPANAMLLQRRLESLQRKQQRKESHTLASDPTQVHDLGEAASGPGPGTLMSRLMREELESQQRGGRLSQLFNQPWVVVTLFVLCVSAIVWRFWPRSDAEESAPEAASPAARWSEAERFFHLGQRRFQDRDYPAARAIWQDVVRLFGANEADAPWVRRAEKGLAKLQSFLPSDDQRRDAIRQSLARVKQAWEKGDHAEARQLLNDFEKLYRDDSLALQVIGELKKELEPAEKK